jgi:hypothetical protein
MPYFEPFSALDPYALNPTLGARGGKKPGTGKSRRAAGVGAGFLVGGPVGAGAVWAFQRRKKARSERKARRQRTALEALGSYDGLGSRRSRRAAVAGGLVAGGLVGGAAVMGIQAIRRRRAAKRAARRRRSGLGFYLGGADRMTGDLAGYEGLGRRRGGIFRRRRPAPPPPPPPPEDAPPSETAGEALGAYEGLGRKLTMRKIVGKKGTGAFRVVRGAAGFKKGLTTGELKKAKKLRKVVVAGALVAGAVVGGSAIYGAVKAAKVGATAAKGLSRVNALRKSLGFSPLSPADLAGKLAARKRARAAAGLPPESASQAEQAVVSGQPDIPGGQGETPAAPSSVIPGPTGLYVPREGGAAPQGDEEPADKPAPEGGPAKPEPQKAGLGIVPIAIMAMLVAGALFGKKKSAPR